MAELYSAILFEETWFHSTELDLGMSSCETESTLVYLGWFLPKVLAPRPTVEVSLGVLMDFKVLNTL